MPDRSPLGSEIPNFRDTPNASTKREVPLVTSAPDLMWEFIGALPTHTIFKASDLLARFGAPEPDIKATIRAALEADLVVPVYRISNGDVTDPQAHAWTHDLMSLRRTWKTTSGADVDGADPREIMVGFERTPAAVQEQS